MAKPHGKNLLEEPGKRGAHHWYDFVKPHRKLLTNGPRVKTKSGVSYFVATNLMEEKKGE